MIPQVFTALRFSSRIVVQMSACVMLGLLVVVSATATVSAPQAHVTTTTPRPLILSRTPSPRATATSTRAAVTRTSTARAVAPRSMPGQPQVDAHTIALYHFDSPNAVAVDATGNYTGTLHGNAIILDSGLYAGVLNLDGNSSYVRTGYLGSMPQGTIELFVDFQEACQQGYTFTLFSVGGEFGSNSSVLRIGQFPGRFLGFDIYSDGVWHSADSGINACRYLTSTSGQLWPYETWRFHHMAVTWGPRGMEIWVDGVLHGVGTDYPDAYIRPYKYMCNPQMQMGDMDGEPPNPLYPACKTPVMAPTMPAYPPGDYTGGLSDYATMLIGCDSNGSCFKGRIDEVRISNIQRTFHWSVVPTVTPTPTWTPISPSGEYSVDAYTQALYHLNFYAFGGVWEEVSQTYHNLIGLGRIVPNGRFGPGLSLDGYSRVDIGDPGALFQGTVEAWVLFEANQVQPIFAVPRNDVTNQMLLFLGSLPYFSTLRFGIYDGEDIMYWVDSGVTPSSLAGCWHHIAGTWGPRGMEIWIDGILRNADRNVTLGMAWSHPFWRLGCDNNGQCMTGILDEARISRIQRIFVSPSFFSSRLYAPRNSEVYVYLPLIVAGPAVLSCPYGP